MYATYRSSWLAVLGIAALTLGGCASAARTGNMAVPADRLQGDQERVQLSQTLRVASVSGGKGTNPMWKSKIGNPEFRAALEQSLSAAGLTAVGDQVKYLLDVELVQLDQPSFGFSLSVTMTVNYRLKEAATGRLVWRDSISASYTARMSESVIGVKRLRLASEGAARENISELIDTLRLLKLDT